MAEITPFFSVFLTKSSLAKNIFELIFLVIIFILILVACVLTTRFIAGRQLQKNKLSNFKPLETYQVAPNRYLQLVSIGTRFFVISVSKDGVRLITEMKEDEIVVKDTGTPGQMKSFKEILSELRGKVDKHEKAEKK